MQNELLPIGKMAEMNHLTVATLRLYDELGLLHPRHRDPESGSATMTSPRMRGWT